MNKNITFSLDEKLIEELKKVSKETMIPQSKIVRLGIELALKHLSQDRSLGDSSHD
jgi:predicted DNA-binding protein